MLLLGLMLACGPSSAEYAGYNNRVVALLDSARTEVQHAQMLVNTGYRTDGDSIVNRSAYAKALVNSRSRLTTWRTTITQTEPLDRQTAQLQTAAIDLINAQISLVKAYDAVRALQLKAQAGELRQAALHTRMQQLERAPLEQVHAAEHRFRILQKEINGR